MGRQRPISDRGPARKSGLSHWVFRWRGHYALALSRVLQFRHEQPMPDTAIPLGGAVLEVVSPDGARRYVRIAQMPFLIGRGAETGNHLQLSDRRISRNCAAIVTEAGKFYIEDRGQRRGLFINREKTESRELQDGDSIT